MKIKYVISLLFFIFSIAQAASKEDTPKKYYALCREIDRKNQQFFNSGVEQIKQDKDYEHVRNYRCKIDLLRQHQEEKKEQVFHEFKNYYEIENNDWNTIRFCLTSAHGLGKKKAKIKMVKDANFSENAEQLIRNELSIRRANINHLTLSSNVNNTFAYSVKMVSKKRGIVGINTKFWKKSSPELRTFVSACIAQELTEELSLFPWLLQYFWHTIISSKKQNDFSGVIRFKENTRVVVMRSVCLMNKKSASLIKKYVHSVINPYFTSDDYAFISKVDRYWRLINIGKQCTIPRLCLRPSMIRPDHDSSNSEDGMSISPDSLSKIFFEEQKDRLVGYDNSID